VIFLTLSGLTICMLEARPRIVHANEVLRINRPNLFGEKSASFLKRKLKTIVFNNRNVCEKNRRSEIEGYIRKKFAAFLSKLILINKKEAAKIKFGFYVPSYAVENDFTDFLTRL
jgi:hypothetical protein